MVQNEQVKKILNRMDDVLNQAYELDEELDVDTFLETLEGMVEELWGALDDEHE